MKPNRFLEMSDNELCKTLKKYADERKGEIAELCYAASIRIGVLQAGIKRFREEDDGE